MFNVLHDTHKPLVFVGETGLNKQMQSNLDRESTVVSLEYAKGKDDAWFSEHQFMCVSGDLDFKTQVVEFLESKNANFFSLVGTNNLIDPGVTIGKNTFINNYNDMLGYPLSIGDNVVISCFCQLGRDVKIGNYCHISSYVYVNNCHVGEGTAIGTRSSVLGPKLTETDTKYIAPYCNFLANSVITKNITETGTYFGNRKSSGLGRSEYRII